MKQIIAALFLFSICHVSFADTITLKSGQVVDGEIVTNTDEFIEVDSGVGVTVTYYQEDIEKIEKGPAQPDLKSQVPNQPPAGAPSPLIMGDDYPSGQLTPEGVACEMARAFINADEKLWRTINNPKLVGRKLELKVFVDTMAGQMNEMAALDFEKRPGAKKITQVYKARHLSKNGPSSYGWATFNFNDVMFVDVITELANGQLSETRTLVVQDEDEKWYVLPRPDLYPILSMGLNKEASSTEIYRFGDPQR